MTGTGRESLITRVENTMPLGDADNCTGDCASDVVDYILALREQSCSATSSKPDLFNLRPIEETLYSAILNLVSRFPSDDELLQIQNDGQEGLEAVLDQIMTEEAFAERIMEIYGDLIQVEQFSPTHGHSGAILDINFRDESWVGRWYDQYGERDYEDHVNLIRAHVREPLQLVKHVVQEGLDFREILTADYVMVNNLNAFTYDPYETEQFPYKDIGEYRPFYNTERPRIGILGTVAFMYKFETTAVNRNRKRAYAVFELFLDTDIRTLGGTVVAAADLEAATDVYNDPDCRSCHTIMDPVASAFKHYNTQGTYKPNDYWPDEMAPPGFAGVTQPEDSSVEPLRWVAEQIVNDPRFARATVRTIFEGIFGQDVIRISAESLPEQVALYDVQQRYLVPWADLLIESNFNIRTLVKAMIMSDYYQAASIVETEFSKINTDLNSSQKTFVEERIGGATLLTPEMLARKLLLLTEGNSWGETIPLFDGFLDPINVENGLSVLYGGIDFKDNTQRLRDLNGFMLAIQERMSYDIACKLVASDFDKFDGDRLVFNDISAYTDPSLQSEQIKAAIVDLIWLLWGQIQLSESQDVSDAYELLLQIYQANIQEGTFFYNCNGISDGGRHLKMAIAGVLTYLLSDYRFNNL